MVVVPRREHAPREELVEVDLVAAYWSIYTRTTLDVDYDGERPPVRGGIEFLEPERLGEHRLMRNALVGSIRRMKRHGVDHGEYFVERVPESLRRPNLWGLVMDCLELVAWEMRARGAVYVHTDGYVFGHRDLAEDAIEALRGKFGLDAAIKAAGPGIVMGLGRFQIGEKETAHGIMNRPGRRIDSMTPFVGDLAESLTAFLKHARLPASVSRETD